MKQKLNEVGHLCFLSASVDDPFYLAVNKAQGQWRTLASFSVVLRSVVLKESKEYVPLWLLGQGFLFYSQQMAVAGRAKGLNYSRYI